MNILLSGANGAMGLMLQDLIENTENCQVLAGFDREINDNLSFPVYSDLSNCHESIDVIIDFSHFEAFPQILKFARDQEIPIVIATTGLSEDDLKAIEEASQSIPIFKTANLSLGINLLAKALKDMVGKLEEGFDIEIIEKHHHKKVDAPSGTAFLLADAINENLKSPKTYSYGRQGRNAKRSTDEMGIHAIRGGTIPGEHTVIFAGNDEIIELKHSALSKKVFAEGALKAARYLVDQKPGLYNMPMLLG